MKRYILFLLVAMLECGIMFSQNNRPLSPMLNISGEFKRDYKDVKKGTACILQRVIKLKKPIGQEESTLQAVVVVGGVQVGIPMEELDVLKVLTKFRGKNLLLCNNVSIIGIDDFCP